VATIFIANVGVNSYDASARGMMSPIFPDRKFEFIPIKEPARITGVNIPRYSDLRCVNQQAKISLYLPERVRQYCAHDDPEFITFTYGDVTRWSRGSNLQWLQPGDFLFFLARLVPWQDGNFSANKGGFYLIGYLEVNRIFQEEGEISEYSALLANNAHFKRYQNGQEKIGDFRIIKGNPKSSKRFSHAITLDKTFCTRFLRDKYGNEFDWQDGK